MDPVPEEIDEHECKEPLRKERPPRRPERQVVSRAREDQDPERAEARRRVDQGRDEAGEDRETDVGMDVAVRADPALAPRQHPLQHEEERNGGQHRGQAHRHRIEPLEERERRQRNADHERRIETDLERAANRPFGQPQA